MLEKHNLNCKSIETSFVEKGIKVILVYTIKNDGTNEGLEAYYYKPNESHFYRSRTWETEKIPLKYVIRFEKLKKYAKVVPNGHKAYIGG
jgi:hypothetical protein